MSNDKNIIGEVSGEVDPKLHMEAMIGEMRRMLRLELEQVHKRKDRMENSRVEQPQSSNYKGGREYYLGKLEWKRNMMGMGLMKKMNKNP